MGMFHVALLEQGLMATTGNRAVLVTSRGEATRGSEAVGSNQVRSRGPEPSQFSSLTVDGPIPVRTR